MPRTHLRATNGITLIEVLVVVAIIAVLAAILVPTFAKVRSHAWNVQSTSNLRQTGIALLLYADDWGGVNHLPSYVVATQVTAKMPTCDPKDCWRSSCEVPVGRPQLGSYGYSRAILDDLQTIQETLNGEPADWGTYILTEKPILLINPFYGDEQPCPFIEYPPPVTKERLAEFMLDCRRRGLSWRFPTRFLRLRLDGSAEIRKFKNDHWLGADWAAGLL